MDAGLLDGNERRFDAEHVTDAVGRQHLCRSAGCYHMSMVQQHELVSKASGEIQIVNHSDRDNIRSGGEAAHLFHKYDLVMNVQKS